MKIHTKETKEHLRNYFLFNYDNYYRIMVDNNVIGLSGLEKDLSIVYNAHDTKSELNLILNNESDASSIDKNSFDKLLFALEVGDAVCLCDTKTIKAIGIIESNYQYTPNKELPHARKVKWLSFNKILIEDGNPRIKIRKIEKESTYKQIEQVINVALLEEGDSSLLINYPSRITIEKYISLFKKIKLNPHEVEVLNTIYNNQTYGISIFELQKQFVGIDVEESLEALAHKISSVYRLEQVENRYTPNLFNGILRDGHLCIILKEELSKALELAGIVYIVDLNDSEYNLNHAKKDSVYPTAWFEEAYELLLNKHSLHLIGKWGTGKSYFARRLAFLINKSRSLNNIFHIKMHPALKYDDLLSNDGIRPLYRFIEQARKNSIENFVIIFEDCHEAKLNEVIGELGYLIEDNNRDREGSLDVNFDNKKYYIPKNVYIIMTSRDNPDLFDASNLSNMLYYILPTIYTSKFINMFEDIDLGRFIARNYVIVNEILLDYNLSFNHGLFLKSNRGLNKKEYDIVIKHKIEPIIKRLISENDYNKVMQLIKFNE